MRLGDRTPPAAGTLGVGASAGRPGCRREAFTNSASGEARGNSGIGGQRWSVLGGDEFARLFEASAAVLWCVAASVTGDRERARDVVQDAAIIGLERRAEFRPGTSFVNWMSAIVRFTALNESRREHRRSAAGGDHIDAMPGRERGGGAAGVSRFGELMPGQNAFDDQLVAALRELEPGARACLLMRTVLEMPYPQIAEALGIPEGTAMSHVHRARRRMRERLLAQGRAGGTRAGEAT